MESIIKDNIQEHMISNNLILSNQHGFTAGRSCTTKLLTTINYWTKALEEGHSVDVLYFNFAKAFDSVPHNCFIAKLQGLGVSGRLLTWLKNFLVNRKQKVVLNTCSSSWSSVKSSVPQGSVLGPVLFNIYVSDMPRNVDSILLQFADDVKMFRAIKTTQDFHCLQSDIDKLVAWCKLWQLNFNVSKCNLLHLGSLHTFGEYTINGL